jgi:thiamine-phosphate pyrophosphorylase
MWESFTAGALRVLDRAGTIAAHQTGRTAVHSVDLLNALIEEQESRASAALTAHGFDPSLLDLPQGPAECERTPGDLAEQESPPLSQELRLLLIEATGLARAVLRYRPDLADALAVAGLDVASLESDLGQIVAVESAPIVLAPEDATFELATPADTVDLYRMLDASSNRAREGLRVIEDYARFVLDDPGLLRRLKEMRHRLAEATRGLDAEGVLAARDTKGDVGTAITTAQESSRESPRAVLLANFKRSEEALRSLEEYAKLVDVWVAGRFEVLRYDLYTLEKLVLTAAAAHGLLTQAHLYLLIGGLPTIGELTWLVGEALEGGTQVIQLREKRLPDRQILEYAREVRILTARAGARFILNDRPDLARLAGADGVHLGQDDLRVRDARRVLGSKGQIGVSTHSRQQIEAAIVDGAGYLGVGPVFTSETKAFHDLPGLALVETAAALTNLPWFAIGGINEASLDRVFEAGATRIAVSSAIVRADRPRAAARALRQRLDAHAESSTSPAGNPLG